MKTRSKINAFRKFGIGPGSLLSRRDKARIAQRFSVGNLMADEPSPEGTAEFNRFLSLNQPSLRDLSRGGPQPNAEALGYSQKSLRDKGFAEFPKGIGSKTDRRQRGSVLVITLLLALILVFTLGGYLWWVRTQNVQVAEAQSWNAALAIAEAGIEEGMAQINVSAGNFLSATNYGPSVLLNFGPLAGGVYGPRTNSLFDGFYSVTIQPNIPGPTIVASGYTQLPMVAQPIKRTVRVTTMTTALFSHAMVALSNIVNKGNGLTVDSYDSADPLHSTNGMYYAPWHLAGGDVATVWGSVTIQNADIYGHLYTGPSGTYSIGANGLVGDLNWKGPGVEAGWYANDFTTVAPDVQVPYTLAQAAPVFSPNKGKTIVTNYLTGGNYLAQGDYTIGMNEYLVVSGVSTLYVTGNFTMQDMNSSVIQINSGASLTLYVGTPDTTTPVSTTLTQVNTVGNALSFQYYGLPSNTSLKWGGNAAYVGTVYAPEANFDLGGGGSTDNDYQGACVVQSVNMNGHFKFHFDENLRRIGPMTGFSVSSWQEIF